LLNDARDGHWDEHTLIAASLIASGVGNDMELRATCDLFRVIAAELNAELKNGPHRLSSAQPRAEATLAFLHRRILRGGYDLYATELPDVFATGRFNCVSATVLFNSLAAEAGLEVGALRLPHHTCTQLLDQERRVRVEATCADWSAASAGSRLIDDSAGAAPFAARPKAQSEPPEAISDVALVAMIYYNRGVEALKRMDFEQAIGLNRLALTLDPHNSSARGNLLGAINKQALHLTERRQFAAALSLVDEGLEIDPDHEPLRQNRSYIKRASTLGAAP
jgi:tetratricopeptide (TPR) repeat protein